MSKSLITVICAVLLVGGIFIIIHYKQARDFQEKFGSYEQVQTQQNVEAIEETKAKQDKVVDVYAKVGAPEAQILALKNTIEHHTGVLSLQYTSAEKVLADFKAAHQNDQYTLQAMNELGSNPFGARISITISDPSTKRLLVQEIRSNDTNSVVEDIKCGLSGSCE